MKSMTVSLLIVLVVALSGCTKFHKVDLPDPQAYRQAVFDDFDYNGDGMVTSFEFSKYFPDSDPEVFGALDLNGNGTIEKKEWERFKEAH